MYTNTLIGQILTETNLQGLFTKQRTKLAREFTNSRLYIKFPFMIEHKSHRFFESIGDFVGLVHFYFFSHKLPNMRTFESIVLVVNKDFTFISTIKRLPRVVFCFSFHIPRHFVFCFFTKLVKRRFLCENSEKRVEPRSCADARVFLGTNDRRYIIVAPFDE